MSGMALKPLPAQNKSKVKEKIDCTPSVTLCKKVTETPRDNNITYVQSLCVGR